MKLFLKFILLLVLSKNAFGQQESLIFIPIKLDKSELIKTIEKSTPSSLKISESSKTQKISAKFKLKDIETSFSSNTVKHEIRITDGNGTYKKRGYTDVLGNKIYSPWAKANFSELRGNGSFSASITLKPNYKIYTSAEIKFKADNLKIYGINATSALKFFNQHHLKKNISEDLNKELNKFDLKGKLNEIWNDIQKPIFIDSNLFLLISPNNILFKNITFDSKSLNFGLGMTFEAKTGNKQSADAWKPNKILPKLKIVNDIKGNNISLNLPLDISFKSIQSNAKKALNGTFIMKENKKGKMVKYAKILDVEIIKSIQSEYDIKLGLNVKVLKVFKNRKGFVYLDSKLDYNKKEGILSLTDYKIDAQTNDWIANTSFEFLANHFAYNFIKKKLIVDVNLKVEESLSKINLKLSNKIEITPGVFLTGEMKSISVKEISTEIDKLFLDVNLEGNIAIDVIEIKQK